MVPVVDVDDVGKKVLKEAVASTYKYPSDPTGGTPTSEAYYEMRRYMMGQSPIYGEDGNGNYQDETICLKEEKQNICEDVDVEKRVEISGTCNTNSWDCERSCNATTVYQGNCWLYDNGWSTVPWTYYQISYVKEKQCSMQDVCVRPAPIVEAGKYVSPMNMNNQCESNYVIVMTDGAPSKNSDKLPYSLCSSATGSISSSYTCQEKTASYLNSDSNAMKRKVITSNIGLYMGSYKDDMEGVSKACLLYTSSPRDGLLSRMPSSA